jgi:hypothetical protein
MSTLNILNRSRSPSSKTFYHKFIGVMKLYKAIMMAMMDRRLIDMEEEP